MKIKMKIVDEFHLYNFGLNHIEPRRFVSSEWGSPRFYTAWRIFWALFHTTWLVISLSQMKTSPVSLWFIYLSNWTYLLLTLSTVLDLIILLYVHAKRRDLLKGFSTHLPWYMKISWVLNNIVTEGSLHITGFYWVFIFKDHSFTMLRFIFHGVNSIYVLSNLMLSAMPVRLCHVIHPIIYGIIYTVFTVVYHVLGGTNVRGEAFIYKILDWSKWKRTLPLVCLSTFVVLPFIYIVVYFIHYARIYIRTKQEKSNSDLGYLKSSPNQQSEENDYVQSDVTVSERMIEESSACETQQNMLNSHAL